MAQLKKVYSFVSHTSIDSFNMMFCVVFFVGKSIGSFNMMFFPGLRFNWRDDIEKRHRACLSWLETF